MERKVSIVIPVYNGVSHLKDSVRSVPNRDYENIEIIVVGNAPQDGTTQWLCQLTDSQVTVIQREELSSASENWTQAIELASGTYIKLL